MQIQVTIYPSHFAQEPTSETYLHDAAASFANELSATLKSKFPTAAIEIDIKPVSDDGMDGGCHCADQPTQDDCQAVYDRIFNEGAFWPEITG